MTESQYKELLHYHQLLRDLPEQPGWPSINMPQKPSWIS
ncbi:phage tail assembly chaperone [Aeromonas finlandensis]